MKLKERVENRMRIADLGLNDFRMDLLNYIKTNEDLGHLPSGLHAIVPSNLDMGLKPGLIFTLRNRNSGVNQHNKLHPYYLIYIGNDGEVITDHTQVKPLLALIRSSCKGQSKPIQSVCYLFNEQTKDGRNMSEYSELLNSAGGTSK